MRRVVRINFWVRPAELDRTTSQIAGAAPLAGRLGFWQIISFPKPARRSAENARRVPHCSR